MKMAAASWIFFPLVMSGLSLRFVQAENDVETKLIWTVGQPNSQLSWTQPYMMLLPGDPLRPRAANVSIKSILDSTASESLASVTYVHSNAMIYYMDNNRKAIYGADVTNFAFSEVHEGLGNSFQITVDWQTGNMYWVDGLFQWVAMKSLRKGDHYDFRVIVNENAEQPTGIALNPKRGYLYWCNAGRRPAIYRSSLTGESSQVLVYGGMFMPRGMAIDVSTGTVYWIDYEKETIEQCDYDGGNRKILRRVNGGRINGIVFYKNSIIGAGIVPNRLLFLRANTGTPFKEIRDFRGQPQDVIVYSSENQPSLSDPCSALSCDHYCFAVQSSPTSGRCLCQEGFELQADNKSCSGSVVYGNKLLIIATKEKLCLVNITYLPSIVNCVTNGSDITAVTADSANRLIYFADRGDRAIHSWSAATGLRHKVTTAGDITGLVFDWLQNTLFWTDAESQSILSYNVPSGIQTTVVTNAGDNLGRISLDPFTRTLFWVTGSSPSIRTRPYDEGGAGKTLVSEGIEQAEDLYCDPVNQILHWTDRRSIKKVAFNGTGQDTSMFTSDDNHGLVLYKNYFFWSSSTSTQSFINSADNVLYWHAGGTVFPYPSVVDLDVMDGETQQATRGVCFRNGGCDHYCVPTSRSRVCKCELGYTLQMDGQTCSTKQLKVEYILLGDYVARRLYQLDISTGELYGKFPLNDLVIGLATNPDNTRIYWSEDSARQIMSSNFDGSDASPLIDTGTERAEGISVDDSTGNLYYTASNYVTDAGYIAVVSPDGKARKTVITGLHTPRAIKLDVAKRLMFWTDFGSEPGVWRANMDGSQKIDIITTNIQQPNGIALEGNNLYWSDAIRNVIEKCTLLGASREEIVKDPEAHIVSLLIVRDKLYYTAWNRAGVTEVNKANGRGRRLLAPSAMIGLLHDLILVTPNKRPSVQTACSFNNGLCSTLCLPNEIGRTCACADRVQLESDGRTCKGAQPIATEATMGVSSNSSTTPTTISKDSMVTDSSTTPIIIGEESMSTGNMVPVIAASTTSGVVVVVAIVIVTLIVLRKRTAPGPSSGTTSYLNPISDPYYATVGITEMDNLGDPESISDPGYSSVPSNRIGSANNSPNSTPCSSRRQASNFGDSWGSTDESAVSQNVHTV